MREVHARAVPPAASLAERALDQEIRAPGVPLDLVALERRVPGEGGVLAPLDQPRARVPVRLVVSVAPRATARIVPFLATEDGRCRGGALVLHEDDLEGLDRPARRRGRVDVHERGGFVRSARGGRCLGGVRFRLRLVLPFHVVGLRALEAQQHLATRHQRRLRELEPEGRTPVLEQLGDARGAIDHAAAELEQTGEGQGQEAPHQ